MLNILDMVNPPPVLSTIATDTWVEANWEDFLTFADDPTLASGRFYYDQGYMRIEMSRWWLRTISVGACHLRRLSPWNVGEAFSKE